MGARQKQKRAGTDAEGPNPFWHSLLTTLVTLISRLVAIPLFLIAHKYVPNPVWPFHLDRVLLLILIFAITEFTLKYFRNAVIIGLLLAAIYLTTGSITGRYGFGNLGKDYRAMLEGMLESPHPEEILTSKLVFFPNKNEIISAIDFDNRIVRDFALKAVAKHFRAAQKNHDYRTIIQCFAVFKEINSKWNYVQDPKSREYFAKASESVSYLAGDCDDHSICMAACVKSIGGVCRLVHTDGHLYPEILVGSKQDMENVNYLIKRELFPRESYNRPLHYHIDENGNTWLNLDYTANYPGGKFLSERILGVLTLD